MNDIELYTTDTVEGRRVQEYLGVVTIIADSFQPGRLAQSFAIALEVEDARKQFHGANAVIGVRPGLRERNGDIVFSGTAVKLSDTALRVG